MKTSRDDWTLLSPHTCVFFKELAVGSVHGGGGGHQAAVHAGWSPAGVSRCSFLWKHGEDECPAGHDEDGQSQDSAVTFYIQSVCSFSLTLHIASSVDVCFHLNPQLVSCGVSSYQHTSVSLEFFETVVRYDKFFIVEPQHIPNVLVSDCLEGFHELWVTGDIRSWLVLCSLSDGVSGPKRTETQQPKGPQQGGLPLLQIHQNSAVSPVCTHLNAQSDKY